jgi:hypothetical protein
MATINRIRTRAEKEELHKEEVARWKALDDKFKDISNEEIAEYLENQGGFIDWRW